MNMIKNIKIQHVLSMPKLWLNNFLQKNLTPLYIALAFVIPTLIIFYFGSPITFGYDPHKERCLPNVKWVVMLHYKPSSYEHGEMVFFKPQKDILNYVKSEYISKVVVGVPGDKLTIRGGEVFINDKKIVVGFPLAQEFYHHQAADYDQTIIIPEHKLFLVGYHPLSDDSRYWGFLDTNLVAGKAIPL